jgi:RecA/RadA recombinase
MGRIKKSVKQFQRLLDASENPYISIVEDGVAGSDVTEFVDSGSYVLNAQLSGSIYGGWANNKISALAGEEKTGKTFFALSACAQFLKANPTGCVFYFDTERAITKDVCRGHEIDLERIAILGVATVEDFRTQVAKMLDNYLEQDEKDRMPIMFVLDSLGMLSTNKEMHDISEGSDKRDMTRSQLVKGAFRALTLKLGVAKVPMLVTNHTYAVVGSFFPTKDMGGGGGLKYAASTIMFLGKKKERTGTEVTGAIVTSIANKSRLTKEQTKTQLLIRFSSGLDRYYGLLPLAEEAGVIKKTGKRWEFPNGKAAFETAINANPENWFTEDVLNKINEYAAKKFLYGSQFEEDSNDTDSST